MKFEEMPKPQEKIEGTQEQPVEAKETMEEKVRKLEEAEKEKSLEKEPTPAMQKHRSWAERATKFALEKISKIPEEVLIPGGAAATMLFLTAPLWDNLRNPVEINQAIALGIMTGIGTAVVWAGSKMAEKMVERDRDLDIEEKSLIDRIETSKLEIAYAEHHLASEAEYREKYKDDPDALRGYGEQKYWNKMIKIEKRKMSVREKKLARVKSRLEKLGQAA